MERDKKHHHHHRDGSEIQKNKYLMAARNRKLMAKWGFRLLCLVAVIVAMLVVLSYFIE